MRIIENETGSRIVEPHFHCLAEELVNFENVSFGIISLESLNIKQSVAVVDAYINLLSNNNVEEFYNKLNEGKIDYYKNDYKSLKQMKMALNLFRRDPYGYKKNIYKKDDFFDIMS